MDRTRKLNEIAEIFQAANRLSGIMTNNNNKTRGDMDIAPSRLNTVVEAISLLNGFTPNNHRNTLENAVKRSYTYSSAYKNLKKHIGTRDENRQNSEMFLGTLKAIRPVMNSRQVHMLDKIIKVYDILING